MIKISEILKVLFQDSRNKGPQNQLNETKFSMLYSILRFSELHIMFIFAKKDALFMPTLDF